MAFGSLARIAINYTSDYPTKDSATDGTIKKLDTDLSKVFTAVDTTAALTSNSDDKLPTQKAVKTYADTKLAFDVDYVGVYSICTGMLSITETGGSLALQLYGYHNLNNLGAETVAKGGTGTRFNVNAGGSSITLKTLGFIALSPYGLATISRNDYAATAHLAATIEAPSTDLVISIANLIDAVAFDCTSVGAGDIIRVNMLFFGRF